MTTNRRLQLGRLTLDRHTEIVERKGLGHPDTVCDALAEELSRGLSRYYLEHFGAILHHNVDKVLLRGGAARATFGGGKLLEPIEIYLAGRATTNVGGVKVPVQEIAVEGSRRWLQENIPELDASRDVRIHCLVREGSTDLTELYSRKSAASPSVLANDTSFGVGYAPLSRFEQLLLDVENALNAKAFCAVHPESGGDVKVMGVREGSKASLTIARAFVARHLRDARECARAKDIVRQTALELCDGLEADVDVGVNVADDPERGSFYLTVTGTSAEAGDDGQVGRGNRANGLITPQRPMSLEAVAGKNPVSHVGKLYNVAAREIAERIVIELPLVEEAVCLLVSEIGRPIDDPRLVHIEVAARSGAASEDFRDPIEQIVELQLSRFEALTRRLVDGTVMLF